MAAFRLADLADTSSGKADVARVAMARAVTPMRRPGSDPHQFTEEQPLPSQRRSDLMAPQRVGFWSLLPYMAATVTVGAVAWVGAKRFQARQARLVDEFGEVIVVYGNTPDTKLEITSEYKRKLGPGVLRGGMFSSYLRSLITEKPVVPSTIQDVAIIKKLLRLGDAKAVKVINALGESLQKTPSLLGKLLFISERLLVPEHAKSLNLVPLFPYSAGTVADLQRNMLERCYSEFVNQHIEENNADEPPMAAAAALRIDPPTAKELFDGVVLSRIRKREAAAAAAAAAAAEESSKPSIAELDYPARSGEPAKAAVHAYQCSDCGYTLFPAAGREFKFYGDDFVCPACGAPKDKFVDLNAEE